ncbi:putative redox protein, regulator of disulfide bond formation [Owenweeksia hongkongensis DSM 17368]|uniref:Putative redox protein, regulator of disulfide bond formation n=1 Tax=Owenweeksia hongkongensis (strain DSM 17368 / CIP 108786 / JCM 12287 / NRRL B-23963 / UST20020801) TaxID=926562 RepID=G8R3I0_OWEHD|nr:bifunctional alpha/beta hydrolase/OsmC family protein [Owenweeksia hongkongensis]AEV33036.1 putative redox protein, regulator of disulfide bond formation [Owenweeksia hongkongensis DSM 17368]
MKSEKVKFKNKEGVELAGKLELPLDKRPDQFAIFAHCFTCGKDLKSERNIALALTQKGWGVLRFDFTGLGQSGGDFSDSNFTSNVNDLFAAAEFLKENHKEPTLLIGHSLGGAAVLIAGAKMDSVRAIATIGAPSEPDHVTKLFTESIEEIKEKGEAKVLLAGREFSIKDQFVKDLENTKVDELIKELRGKATLVMHSPQDDTVGIANARHLYEKLHHPKSFVSLDGADHLLSYPSDSAYAGDMIANWVQRYAPARVAAALETDEQVVVRLNDGPFLTEILAGKYHILADEPKSVGGEDLGPSPYELVSAGLGACTAMTIKMYANRKDWPLKEVKVHLSYDNSYFEDIKHCDSEERKIGKFIRIIEVEGDLDEKQRERILQIANKCPVHKTLESSSEVETKLKEI